MTGPAHYNKIEREARIQHDDEIPTPLSSKLDPVPRPPLTKYESNTSPAFGHLSPHNQDVSGPGTGLTVTNTLSHTSSALTMESSRAPSGILSAKPGHLPLRADFSTSDEEKGGAPDEPDAFEVHWAVNDPENPLLWSVAYRSWLTFLVGMVSMAAAVGSAITAPGAAAMTLEFGISSELVILQTSLYLVGQCFGPVLWAPVSEIWGRRWSLLPAMAIMALFSMGAGLSQNAATLFICRFLSGLFSAAPVSIVAAAIADIWTAQARGAAISIYALSVVAGPTLGPIIGSAIVTTIGWRWILYVLAIFCIAMTALCAFFLPETYAPVLLKRRAHQLHKTDPRWHHPHEQIKLDPHHVVTVHLARPIRMLLTEPMVACLSFYASFVYALQFLSLEVFPRVYGGLYGWSPMVSSLPFLALFIGEFGALTVALLNQPRVFRAIAANGGQPVPKSRILPMFFGGTIFTIGLFWFGWTAGPPIPWQSSVFAALMLGSGFDMIFAQCINMPADIYTVYAASAVSANTVISRLLAAGLPLAVGPMFDNLGPGAMISILGAVSVLMLPVPFLLMIYSDRLRRMSKFAPYDE